MRCSDTCLVQDCSDTKSMFVDVRTPNRCDYKHRRTRTTLWLFAYKQQQQQQLKTNGVERFHVAADARPTAYSEKMLETNRYSAFQTSRSADDFWTEKDFANSAETARTFSSFVTMRRSIWSPRLRGRPPGRAPSVRRRCRPGRRSMSARRAGRCDGVVTWDSGTPDPLRGPRPRPAGTAWASRWGACTRSPRLFRSGPTPTRRFFRATSPALGSLSTEHRKRANCTY